ncbi:HD domain-containing protein [Candidatus Absconditicoccus praedator]|uniref:HD domain-containing protein n=1 Tax=Candidatus Absconditicoccus praedator TaxID=2735562 RepID=UPI001E28A673|nr:HD domain-containing protein [Candidatus Absconditicoccus praedator]UFX83314.1 HD domain-containing protein [Candidatus Absconditicoccus praedator]
MKLENVLRLPEDSSIQSYTDATKKNLSLVLSSDTNETLPESFMVFLENLDHGIQHTHNVYKKALEIADILEEESGEKTNKALIYVMAVMHDSGRFHLSDNHSKQDKCERQHNKCGVAQIRLFQKRLRSKGYDLDEGQISSIMDYIYNHDYMTERLDGAKLKEPDSLEGQIVRLADRVSTDVREEVRRYWETGKRRNTPLIKDGISLQDRVEFSFDKIGEYIKAGKLDQMMFFFALISISPSDFSHPQLAKIYGNWSREKEDSIDEIMLIAEEEGYDKEKVRAVIDQYLDYFNINLK